MINKTTIIPFVAELALDLSRWTLGVGIIIREDLEVASGLFHAGYDPEAGFSFDLFYFQFIQAYLNNQ